MTQTMTLPDVGELRKEVSAILENTKVLMITCQEDAQRLADYRNGLKGLEKKIQAFFTPHKKRADELHKGLCDSERQELQPVRLAVQQIDTTILTWQREERRRQEDEQRTREAEARKQEDDRRLEEAEQLEKEGRKEEAEAVLNDPTPPAPVMAAAAEKPKLNGASIVEKWDGEAFDLWSLIVAIAQKRAPLTLVVADPSALRKFAESTKGSVEVPGVRFYKKEHLASRAGREA